MSESNFISVEYVRTEADCLAELQADKAAVDGRWEEFGAPVDLANDAKETLEGALLPRVVEALGLDLSRFSESRVVIPESIVPRKQVLGDRIIDLSGGGTVQQNKVTLASLKLDDGSELYASRTMTGQVLRVGLTEIDAAGKTIHSEINFASLGMPREYVTRYTLDTDGQTKKLEASLITATAENYGEITGSARHWPSDRSDTGFGMDLTERQAAHTINFVFDLIDQKTREVTQHDQAA